MWGQSRVARIEAVQDRVERYRRQAVLYFSINTHANKHLQPELRARFPQAWLMQLETGMRSTGDQLPHMRFLCHDCPLFHNSIIRRHDSAHLPPPPSLRENNSQPSWRRLRIRSTPCPMARITSRSSSFRPRRQWYCPTTTCVVMGYEC